MLEPDTAATRTQQRMMTPDYASPEQVRGEAVGTATDIYSLGAVLYKILTGRSPHAFEEPNDSVEAVVCTRDITRPSRYEPQLAGDLDAILLKALRKEPLKRYSTVEQMADDIRSFRESQPIRLRQGEWLYRARKFTRRYWIPVIAAGLAIVGLSSALGIALKEQRLAEKRFDQARRLGNLAIRPRAHDDAAGRIHHFPTIHRRYDARLSGSLKRMLRAISSSRSTLSRPTIGRRSCWAGAGQCLI